MTAVTFRPCPICGRGLSYKGIRFADEEDLFHDLDEALREDGSFDEAPIRGRGEELDDLLSWVYFVGLLCPCGYAYWPNDSFDLKDPSWLREFADGANRRAAASDSSGLFRPCPVCGKQITYRFITFCDCEATLEDMRYTLKSDGSFDRDVFADIGQDPEEMLSSVRCIGIECGCGYTLWLDNTFDLKDPSWLKGFAQEANRRHQE